MRGAEEGDKKREMLRLRDKGGVSSLIQWI